MKFRAIANPKPSIGFTTTGPSEFVPSQSMTLHEILRRFTRGEALPLGMQTTEGVDENFDNPLNVDLEKMAQADLVDKDEFRERLKSYQTRYEDQEHKKSQKAAYDAAEKAKADKEKAIRIAARKMAKENLDKKHSTT